MPRPGSDGEREAGLGHERGLDAPLAADEVDGRRGSWPRADERAADGEAGQHVAGGAAAGDQRAGAGLRRVTASRHQRAWRATFSSTPAADHGDQQRRAAEGHERQRDAR